MLSTVLLAVSLLLSIIACVFAAVCVRIVTQRNARSLSLRKMAEVEAALLDLTDAHQSLLDVVKKLRSRIGMREKRANGTIGGAPIQPGEPNAQTDPDAWYKWAREKHLKGR